MEKRKLLIGGALVLAVGGLVAFALYKAGSPASGVPRNAPEVRVAAVKRQELVQTVVAPGTLKATSIQEIRAPFATTRVRILVGVGEEVKAGQPLAELDSDQQRITVANLQAQVAQAQSSLASLREQQALAPVAAQSELEAARMKLLAAQEAMANASLTASQQVDQARSAVLQIQSQSAALNGKVEQARTALEQAEAAYRADPLNAAAKQAYEQARAVYEEALAASTTSARQLASQLAQAQAALQMAESRAGGEDSVAVQQARAQLQSAQQALEAAQLKVEQTDALAQQIRAAEASLNAAQQALSLAQDKLNRAVVTAPADGTILSVHLEDGQAAMEEALLFRLGTLNQVQLEARVDEVDISKVKPGQQAFIKTNAYLDEKFPGVVTRVAAQITNNAAVSTSPYYEVQALIENPDGKLRGGMSVEATFETATRENAIVVGLESLRETDDGTYVLVVKDNKVSLRPVTLGLRTSTQVEIVSGLEEGEVIVAGPFSLVQELEEGAWVRTEETGGAQ